MKQNNLKAWIVILTVSGFFCFEFFQINMFNALDPELIKTFNTNGTTLSFLSSLYFYGTVLLIIPAGLLLDRMSPRKLILAALFLSLVGTAIFASATSIFMAGFGRFMVGVTGGPFGLLSTIRIASRWFPEHKLAFVTGVIISVGMLGGVLSQTPFTLLVDAVGWREALFINVGIGAAIYLLIWRFVRDCPPEHENAYKIQKQEHKQMGFVNGLFSVVQKSQNWLCGIFACLLNLPIFLLGALWGNLYLVQIYGLSRVDASYVTTMIYVGMLVGSPIFGKFSDGIKSRKTPMLIGNLICLFAFLIVMKNSSLPLNALIFLFFLIGFGSSSHTIVYPTVAESNPRFLTGSSEGLAAVLIMSGGAIFQPIFGWLMERNWDHTMVNDIPLYSFDNFYYALLLMPVCMIICLITLLFMKETRCKNVDTDFSKNLNLDTA